MKNARNIFLTGKKQVGKTTLLNQFQQASCRDFFGFRMEWIREAGQKKALCISPVHKTGGYSKIDPSPENRLVGLHYNEKTHPKTEGFEQAGVGILIESMLYGRLCYRNSETAEGCPVIIMDELGTLEKDAVQFQQTVLNCLDSPLFVLGVLKDSPGEFLDKIRQRTDVCILEVTPENRQDVLDKITKMLS